jgi:hypothetical protein
MGTPPVDEVNGFMVRTFSERDGIDADKIEIRKTISELGI